MSIYQQNYPVDQLMVTERLKERGQLDSAGGEATIASIAGETASAANIRYHCQILKEKAMLRKMIAITTSIRNKCLGDSANPTEILNNLEENIMNLLSDIDLYRENNNRIPNKLPVVLVPPEVPQSRIQL